MVVVQAYQGLDLPHVTVFRLEGQSEDLGVILRGNAERDHGYAVFVNAGGETSSPNTIFLSEDDALATFKKLVMEMSGVNITEVVKIPSDQTVVWPDGHLAPPPDRTPS